MSIMGLDIGTTGCKSTIYSLLGEKLSGCYREYAAQLEARGRTIDPRMIWAQVQTVIEKATAACSEPVEAICLSSFGETFVPIDDSGEPLSEAMLYTDPHGVMECSSLQAAMGEQKMIEISGVKPHSMYSLPKMVWFEKNRSELAKKVYKYLLIEDFIIFKLSGECVIDYSLASRTMAFDIKNKCWSHEILDCAGIPIRKLSKAVPSGTIAGTVKSNLVNVLHLQQGCVVVTGGHDQVCAATGAGVLTPGTSVDGTGTVECITPVFDRPITDNFMQSKGYACVPFSIPGCYVTYAFTFTGGALLKWYCDHFLKQEREQVADGNIYRTFDEKVVDKPTGLLILPHFAGAATPYMDEQATGAILGLSVGTSERDIYQGIMEGVTFEMRLNMELLKRAGVPITELRATGGGAKSKAWLQMKADITGVPVMAMRDTESGTTGCVMMAATALGYFDNLYSAAKVMVKCGQVFEPNPVRQAQYNELYEKYTRIYDSIKGVWA